VCCSVKWLNGIDLQVRCVAVCCSVLQCVAVCCSALQRVTVHIQECCSVNWLNNVLSQTGSTATLSRCKVEGNGQTGVLVSDQHTQVCIGFPLCLSLIRLPSGFHIAPHCNTLQHTATHCNTLTGVVYGLFSAQQRVLQYTATHCTTLHHTATHCNTLQHTVLLCNTMHHTATHTHRYLSQTV